MHTVERDGNLCIGVLRAIVALTSTFRQHGVRIRPCNTGCVRSVPALKRKSQVNNHAERRFSQRTWSTGACLEGEYTQGPDVGGSVKLWATSELFIVPGR